MAGTMVLGELKLGGGVRPVNGVLSAVGTGLEAGSRTFLVPRENLREARVLGKGRVKGIGSLREAAAACIPVSQAAAAAETTDQASGWSAGPRDAVACREASRTSAVMTTSSGRFRSPRRAGITSSCSVRPGSGKTMSARLLPWLFPQLTREEALAVTRIHSVAGVLPPGAGLITRPPFRAPHHSASSEGIIGGGRFLRPGEVSLAHHGVLFLDEAPEFGMSLLQSLREPIEDGWVSIARAGSHGRVILPAASSSWRSIPARAATWAGTTTSAAARTWRSRDTGGKSAARSLTESTCASRFLPFRLRRCASPRSPAEATQAREEVERAMRIQRERYAGFPFPSTPGSRPD